MEKSKNKYRKPFPRGTVVRGISYDSPAHVGPFKGAVDFIVDLGTPVLAPLGGEVYEFEDKSERYGETEEFKDDVNFVTLKHSKGEFSQMLHLAKGSASHLGLGQRIKAGEQIGISGNSGWMTGPHIHMFVFKNDDSKAGFRGLKIQFTSTI